MSRRSRSRRRSGSSRRQFLLRAGAGGALLGGAAIAVNGTGAFSSMTNGRASDMDAASDPEGIVGMVDLSPVKKDERVNMIELTNQWAQTAEYTIGLEDCAHGTLHDNEGGGGCAVYVTLAPGDRRTIDITADIEGTIDFYVTAEGTDFSFDWSGSVLSEKDPVVYLEIKKPDKADKFVILPDGEGNRFEIMKDEVDIKDKDGDADLVEVYYEVVEGTLSGDLVAEKTVSLSPTDQYQPDSDPAEVIEPNAGYSVLSDQLYTFRITAEDADGNTLTKSFESQDDPAPIVIERPGAGKFHARLPGDGNRFEIEKDEVHIKDNDGDADLVEVEYTVYEGNLTGDIVGTKTVSLSPTNEYKPGSDPAETIQPDSGYDVKPGTTYTLKIVASDEDGNSVSKVIQDETTPSVVIERPDGDDKVYARLPADGNVFEIEKDQVHVKDNDGDADLVEVYFEVFEGGVSGDLVGEKTVTLSPTNEYKPGSDPAETIQPDSGYDVKPNSTYTFRITGTDEDGFSESKTFQDETRDAIIVNEPGKDGEFEIFPDGSGNHFEIKKDKVDILDNDGDDDVVEAYYEVFEGTSTSDPRVADKSVTFSATGQYKPGSEPAADIDPDSGYSVLSGQTYTLRVTGIDADGFSNSITRQNSA